MAGFFFMYWVNALLCGGSFVPDTTGWESWVTRPPPDRPWLSGDPERLFAC
jgi:hypothetical protein